MSADVYDLKWGQELANKITSQIRSEIGRIRADPPLIPVVSGSSRYEDVVQSYRVDPGPPFSIRTNSKLAPIKISSRFVVAQQQFSDEMLATRLAFRPASDLAFAEDAILLHGAGAAATLTRLNIEDESRTLDQQEGLFASMPARLPAGREVFDSIREGLVALQENNQHGPYCVILSPDLHREAIAPLASSTTPRIDPILPQLREKGFRWKSSRAGKNRCRVFVGRRRTGYADPLGCACRVQKSRRRCDLCGCSAISPANKR